MPPGDQTAAMQALLHQTLAGHVAAIVRLADQMAEKATPDAFWLAEALRRAVGVPDDTALWAAEARDGQLQPLLVNWARLREDRGTVRGVLTTLAPAAAPGGDGNRCGRQSWPNSLAVRRCRIGAPRAVVCAAAWLVDPCGPDCRPDLADAGPVRPAACAPARLASAMLLACQRPPPPPTVQRCWPISPVWNSGW